MPIPSFHLEKVLYQKGYNFVAGIDEAGRGSWAGPIVAASVILPLDFLLRSWPVKDSKTLSEKQRNKLFKTITRYSVGYKTVIISKQYIDEYGIGQANFEAIKFAALELRPRPEYLLIDNLKTKNKWTFGIPLRLINQGDGKISSIAAASIIAKVTRDRIMKKTAQEYPAYGFEKHKGYGTKEHQTQLQKYGPCPIHRQSYKPIKKFLNP